jgi:MATE family multidrug resistance protein
MMPIFIKKIIKKNRYREILQVCLPLVLSLSATTIMEFTDRVFLANYSIDAISASLPAGITSYLFLAFFGGVGGYAGVFIAQYTGRGEHHKVGTVLWQGIYFTLGSGLFTLLVGLFATDKIFSLAGHPEEVQVLERIYFSILCYGSVLHIGMATLSTFFTGRGLTRPVMIITFIGVIINIPLDYALIYGKWGFPELGIQGAALATVSAWAVNVLLFSFFIFTKKNRRFGVFTKFRFDPVIFKRLMRFGIPGSLQFTLDILAFTLFILLTGQIGKAELAATNIVLSINALAFMPSMGASQGISILVGQALGRKKPKQAATFVRGGCQLLVAYIICVDLLFLMAPDFVLAPFLGTHGEHVSGAEVYLHSISLLKIVCAYLLFDALYMIFSGALRGAGDTRFITLAIACAAPVCLIIPVFIGVKYLNISVTTSWMWVLVFVIALFLISWFRYRAGLWKKMLVIEDAPNQG